MFKKSRRLNGKDVRYITNKRKFFPAGLFGFFVVPQYPNREYNQISFHVTIKLDKRATRRRIVKRAVIESIEEKKYLDQKIGNKYRKIFMVLNKKQLEELQKLIASKDKKNIKKFVQNMFINSFNSFQKKLGK